MPRGEIVLQPPPVLPRGSGQASMQLLFMLPMMLGMGAMSFVYIGRSGSAMTWIFGALYASSMVGMLLMSLSRGGASKKAQINDERRDYLRYLAGLRGQVRDVAVQQRTAMLYSRPDPADLVALAGSRRLWERHRGDPAFGRVRVGIGPQRLATPLRAPQTAPLEDLDPVCSTSLRHFIRTYSTVPDLPTEVSLRAFARVSFRGERPAVLGLARSMLAQLATAHSPEDIRIACCVHPDRVDEWEWLKWLPHALHSQRSDLAGPLRLCAATLTDLADLLRPEVADRPEFGHGGGRVQDISHIVIVIDGGETDPDGDLLPEAGLHGVTIVNIDGVLPSTGPARLELVLDGDRLGMRTTEGVSLIGVTDQLSVAGAEAVARQLTPMYVTAPPRDELSLAGVFGLADLLGYGDPRRIDPAVTWQPRPAKDRLRIPIGIDPGGRPVEFDLKESAEGGMGPHGLVIGATGSGKSELLRTLVTGLAITHSSETLNMALIDFKGGATFAGMAGLPHTCAVITNLAADLTLVDRMADALRGELVRRQELLRASGDYASVRDYERAREAGAPLDPLPSLLIIIDEFSELLSTRPEFIDLFVMIGRLGRSLAVHLLLASQRLEEGRLRGLDSHLSYRIGLRTFSASESRAVLGVPDAYELPPVPGSAFLKVDTSTLIRFKAAYVSGELPPLIELDESSPVPVNRRAVPYRLAPTSTVGGHSGANPVLARDSAGAVVPPGARGPGQTIMAAMLRRLDGFGPAAYQIWLPPLADPPALDHLLPPLGTHPERGLCPEGWPGNGGLAVPVALVDKPFEQRRDLLWADLSGAAGHAVVVGAPQSGKSTLLRTLICALAVTHTPREIQLFLLDFGGGSMSALAGLPHVSGYATRLDPERCRRVVAELTALLAARERQFQELGIDSVATMRAHPQPIDDRLFGDVFLVVDGWMTLRQEYEQLEEAVTTLAARGLGFGIHVLIGANRWMELRPALRDMIGTHFELRLGDPADSAIDRRTAANIPRDAPGRGITRDRLHFLTGLPRVDGRTAVGDLADGVADLVRRVNAAWPGAPAPQVRLLPREVSAATMPAPVPGDRRIPLGLAESDLGPAYLDFDTDPHFIAFGDVESGKTGLLRQIANGIMTRYTPAEATILVSDYRRGLLGLVGPEYLLGYAGSEPVLSNLIGDVAQGMRVRLPGPDLTPEQLRRRTWWTGPELFVLVDDYDMVVTQVRNPIAPLLEFLPQARDIGLHLVLVRRSGGASRAMYEPVLQRLRELATPGLILSGSREEGALLGDVKPSPQPPGRGNLVSRRAGVSLIQVAWTPPADA
jgi:S-DNA-T family DNA segregation ATPase FtsK/SpoIIIE